MSKSQKNIFLFSVLVLAFLSTLIKISDYTIWQVILEGKYLTSGGSIFNSSDPFSYLSNGEGSYNIEAPLGSLLVYFVFHYFSDVGLSILNGLLFAFSIAVMYKTVIKKFKGVEVTDYLSIFISIIVASFAVRMHLLGTMGYISLFFFTVSVFYSNKILNNESNKFYILPLIMILWVYFAGSYALTGVIYYLVFFAVNFNDLRNNIFINERKNLYISIALTFLSVLVSPIGLSMLTKISSYLDSKVFLESLFLWQPFSMSMLTGADLKYSIVVLVLSLMVLISVLLTLDKSYKNNYALIGVFFVLTLMHIGFIYEFALLSIALVSVGLNRLLSIFKDTLYSLNNMLMSSVFVLAIVFLTLMFIVKSNVFSFGVGFKDGAYPVKALNFASKVNISGNLYNSINFGSYVNYKLENNSSRSYISLRNLSKKKYLTYLRTHGEPMMWEAFSSENNIEWVLLEYERDYKKIEQMKHLFDNPDWALIYWDREAMIFAKRGGENQNLISIYEYKYTKPNYFDKNFIRDLMNKDNTLAFNIISELERSLAFNSDNEEARIYMAYMYYSVGLTENELAELKTAARLNPKLVLAHLELGKLYYAYYKFDLAKMAFNEALNIDSRNVQAIRGLELVRKAIEKELTHK